MKIKYISYIIITVLIVTAGWQYFMSQKVIIKDQKPMEIDIILDPMTESANEIARKSEYVYIGSSNQKVKIIRIAESGLNKQLILTLFNKGNIFTDSAFFASQRLVFNTKTRIHALFDGVGVITRIEYIK